MSDTKLRRIIIGLDGVPSLLIKDLTEKGVMPNMRTIIQNGVFRRMESSIPDVSSVAWSSIITGANPGEHGIYGFTDVAPSSYRVFFPNFRNLKVAPFWNDKVFGRSIVINVPATYPAASLNGMLIAGFVALDMDKAVYPSSLLKELEDIGYHIDVDSSKAHMSIEAFLRDLDKTLEARIKACNYFWDKNDWDTFMLVFTGTDRLSHFLWCAYEDESNQFHNDFLEHFRKIDLALGDILCRLREKDFLIILSDHGFERLEKSININAYLRENGFLKHKKQHAKSLNDIDEQTRAFALEPGRIYINLAGKFPRGNVKSDDKEAIINDLIQAFDSLEVDGRKIIVNIYRKEQIYHGDFVNSAPDLVLIPSFGFDLTARMNSEVAKEKRVFTGKHNQHDAFLIIYSQLFDEIMVPEKPVVSDIVNILRENTLE